MPDTNELFYYLVAVPLALNGAGAWALVGGWWTHNLTVALMYFYYSGYRPGFYWNWDLLRQMTGYGLSYSSATWVWQLRDLVNPFIVARYLGAEAVGYIALSYSLTEKLGFVKKAAYRLSLAGLGRLQTDPPRLAQAISEGMKYQVMALGSILVCFVWVAPWLVPGFFGDRWLGVLVIFPFIAFSELGSALFNLHIATLYVMQHNWENMLFNVVYVILFFTAAFLLIPRVGLQGYGWAELAALISYIILHFYVSHHVGKVSYQGAFWFLAFGLALFTYQLGWWVNLGLLSLLLFKSTWGEIRQIYNTILNKSI